MATMQVAERRTRSPAQRLERAFGMGIRIAGRLDIPEWVRDHESFRRWARSDEFPEHTSVAFYDGDLWVDTEMEQLYVHNQIKLKIAVSLTPLAERKGIYVTEGMLLTHPKVGLSTIPDGYYVSDAAFDLGRIREVEGDKTGFVELEGTPDMVLEVVSDSSVTKDLVDLRDLYWLAGVPEYWIVDARSEDVGFELLKRGSKDYIATRKQAGGWIKSETFGKSVRLVRGQSRRSRPTYSLEMK